MSRAGDGGELEEEGNKSEGSRRRRLRGADGREGGRNPEGRVTRELGGHLFSGWGGKEGNIHGKPRRGNENRRDDRRERWKERGRERGG